MAPIEEELSPQEERAFDVFHELVLRVERGEHADVDAACREHPDLEEGIRRWWSDWRAGIEFLERVPARRLSSAAPDRFGESRVIEHATRRLVERVDGYRRYGQRMILAAGGMGTVFRVFDEDLRRHLAMKVLRTETPADARGSDRVAANRVGRFLEEAQVTAQLDHPGIVPVHELGIDPTGAFYFTMKLVRGRELGRIFELARAETEGWNLPRAVAALHKVCEAMAYAHAKGVVHRDLKPSNVMVGRFGEVYVMDWGLARVMGREDPKNLRLRPDTIVVESPRSLAGDGEGSPLLTMDGDVIGTPSFMSPEQAFGETERMGPRSDVYAVGAMLYELLTGCVPYLEGGSGLPPRRVLMRLLDGPPRPILALQPRAPAELVSVCERAMARELEARYDSMEALGEDLRAWLEGRVVRAHETGRLAEIRKWVRRNPVLAGLAATVVVTLPVAAIFVTHAALTRDQVLAAERHERERHVESWIERGYHELGNREGDLALVAFEEAARLALDRPEVASGIELALVQLGRCEEVLRHAAAREQAGDSSPWIDLVRVCALRTLDRADEAKAAYEALPPPASDLDHFLHGFDALLQADRGDHAMRLRAVELLERAILVSPQPRALYYYEWARAVGNGRDPEQTERSIAVLAARWPGTYATHYVASVTAAMAGLVDDALRHSEELVRAHPGHAMSHYARGRALAAAGDSAGARAALEESLRIQPRSARTLYELATLDRAAGDDEAALARLESAHRLDPQHGPTLTMVGNIWMERREHERAIAALRECVRVAPRSALNWMNLGSLLDDTGDYAGAIDAYRRAASIDPESARAHYGLGSALGASGDAAGAIAPLERAVELEPEHARAHNNLAIALRRRGELERALEHYRVALELDPRNHKAHNNLGNALSEAGDLEAALRSYEASLAIAPQYPHALGGLGTTLARLGRFDEAIEVLERALASDAARADPHLPTVLERARLFRELDAAAEDVQSGAIEPANSAEALDFARYCLVGGADERAVELFLAVLTPDGPLASTETDDARVQAASAALRAASRADDARARELRAAACAWIDGFARALDDAAGSGADGANLRRRGARHLLRHRELAPVREEAELERFPADEAAGWRELWRGIEKRAAL